MSLNRLQEEESRFYNDLGAVHKVLHAFFLTIMDHPPPPSHMMVYLMYASSR